MAAVRETLILEDKFTSTMTQCLQVAQRMANMLDDVRASTMNVETAAAASRKKYQVLRVNLSFIAFLPPGAACSGPAEFFKELKIL